MCDWATNSSAQGTVQVVLRVILCPVVKRHLADQQEPSTVWSITLQVAWRKSGSVCSHVIRVRYAAQCLTSYISWIQSSWTVKRQWCKQKHWTVMPCEASWSQNQSVHTFFNTTYCSQRFSPWDYVQICTIPFIKRKSSGKDIQIIQVARSHSSRLCGPTPSPSSSRCFFGPFIIFIKSQDELHFHELSSRWRRRPSINEAILHPFFWCRQALWGAANFSCFSTGLKQSLLRTQ